MKNQKAPFGDTSSMVELSSLFPQLHTASNVESYELAKRESYGFFDYIPDEDWKFRQKLARTRKDHLPAGSSPCSNAKTKNSKLFYLNNYYPSFSCPNVVRVGREPGDGPKFICDPHRLAKVAKERNDTCLVYSIGSKGRFEFELGLQEFTGTDCEIHVIDPGDYARSLPEKMHYHRWGIGSSYDKAYKPFVGGDFKSMQETVKELGHEGRVIDVLKIDCEECEWHSFKDWLGIDFRQILVETHNSPSQSCEFFDHLINAGYMMYSKEPNIHPQALKGEGMCVEWSFIKLDPSFSKSDQDERITCGCNDTCKATALSKRTKGVQFSCEERITYLMTRYRNTELEACSGAVQINACGAECDPEKCNTS